MTSLIKFKYSKWHFSLKIKSDNLKLIEKSAAFFPNCLFPLKYFILKNVQCKSPTLIFLLHFSKEKKLMSYIELNTSRHCFHTRLALLVEST